jgi:hypothetical protein
MICMAGTGKKKAGPVLPGLPERSNQLRYDLLNVQAAACYGVKLNGAFDALVAPHLFVANTCQ